MTPPSPIPRSVIFFLLTLSLALIFITYSNHFHNDFHFDDSHVIQNNIYIRSLDNIPRFFKDATLNSALPENQLYRPLVSTTLALDYAIEKDITRPLWFHISMFTWFLVQCVFLFFFLWKIADHSIQSRWNPVFALFGMTLYGVHTVNAETINYISARSDSMSTCWIIIALVTYAQWPRLRKWGIYLFPWVIACLFKQVAIVFPALIFLYVLLFEQQQGLDTLFRPKYALNTWIKLLQKTAVMWIMALALLYFLIHMGSPAYTPGGNSVYAYSITQPFVMLHYFFSFFLPLQLSLDTDWSTLPSVIDDRFYVGIIFIFTALIIAFIASKKQHTRPVTYGLLWFFITLLPTSSLIPLAEVMNDHRLFFPLIGLIIACCFPPYMFLLHQPQGASLKKRYLVSMCLILCAFSYGTYQRNKVWLTEESLWKDVTLKSPKNGRGLMSYGLTLMGKGDLEQAKKYYLEAEKFTPYYHILMLNLGIVHDALNLTKEAEIYFEKAIRYRPNAPEVYLYSAGHHHRTARPDLAEQALYKALSLSPGNVHAYQNLMQIYWEQENWEKLKSTAQHVLALDPNDKQSKQYQYYADHHIDLISESLQRSKTRPSADILVNLSQSLYAQHQYTTSIKASKKALLLDPHNAYAYNNICASLNALHDYTSAEAACRKAIALEPNFDLAKNNLEVSMHGKHG